MTISINSTPSLTLLPDDINIHVLTFLNADDLIKACKINTLFNKLTTSDFLWNRLTIRVSADITIDLDLIKASCLSWKDTYVIVHKKIEAIKKDRLMQKSEPYSDPYAYRYSVFFMPYGYVCEPF